MEISLDRLLGIVGVLGIVIGVGVAIAMDPKVKGEMQFAIGCFIFSGAALCITIALWGFNTDTSLTYRLLITGLLSAVVCGVMIEASRWANGRYQRATAEPVLTLSEAKSSPKTTDFYKADAGTTLFLPGVLWGVYKTKGDTVTPIDVLVQLQLVNVQKVPVSLTSFSVELNTPHGWMPLRRIPSENVALYWGSITQAKRIKLEPGDIYSELENAEITAGRTIRGTALFEFSDPNYVARPRENVSDFRFTIKDTAGHTAVLESTPKSQSPDPRSNVQSMALIWGVGVVDLSHLPMRRFNAPWVPSSRAQPPSPTTSARPLTLEELFKSDFPNLNKWSNSATFKSADGATMPIAEQMHLDYQGYSRFLSFYLPPSSLTYEACIWIGDHSREIIDQFDRNEVMSRGPTQEHGISTKELKFSGRIFIYTLSDLTLSQQAELEQRYQANGLALEIRSLTYMGFTNLERRH